MSQGYISTWFSLWYPHFDMHLLLVTSKQTETLISIFLLKAWVNFCYNNWLPLGESICWLLFSLLPQMCLTRANIGELILSVAYSVRWSGPSGREGAETGAWGSWQHCIHSQESGDEYSARWLLSSLGSVWAQSVGRFSQWHWAVDTPSQARPEMSPWWFWVPSN